MRQRTAATRGTAANRDRRPYSIVNRNNTDRKWEDLPRLTLPALSELSFPEMKLMLFYESCATGFAPADKIIFDSVGIADRHLYEVRSGLIEKKYLIQNDSPKTLTIDWAKMLEASKVVSMLRMCDANIKQTTGGNASATFKNGTMNPNGDLDGTMGKMFRTPKKQNQTAKQLTDISGNGSAEAMNAALKENPKAQELIRKISAMSRNDYENFLYVINESYERRFGVKMTNEEIARMVGRIPINETDDDTCDVPKDWAVMMEDIVNDSTPEPEPHPDEVSMLF